MVINFIIFGTLLLKVPKNIVVKNIHNFYIRNSQIKRYVKELYISDNIYFVLYGLAAVGWDLIEISWESALPK